MGLRGLINLAKDAQEFGAVTLLYGSTLGIFRSKGTRPSFVSRILLILISHRLQ